MKIYLLNIDRRAALLAGFELGSNPVMNASPGDFGDHWPDVLASLDLTPQGDAVCRARSITVPTVEAVIAAVAADKAYFSAEWEAIKAEVEAAIVALATAESRPLARTIYEPGTPRRLGELTLQTRASMPLPTKYDHRVAPAHREDPIWLRLSVAIAAKEAHIEAANQEAIAAALPRLRAEQDARDKAAAAAAEEADRVKAAKLAELSAERLASGHWERVTSSYNQRREGKPWCANVTGLDGYGKLVYAWGEWTGRVGESGLLRLPCRPGDIIAWGQKDMRRPDKSRHHLQRMKDDGLMEDLSTVEAARALRAKEG